MAQPIGLLEIGTVIKPHGLRGEVVVQLVTNRLERLATGTILTAVRDEVDPVAAQRRVEVLEARPHQDRYLVRFAGIGDRNAAETLRAMTLFAEPIEDDEALFVHDLIGKEVQEKNGHRIGVVTAIEANPASDLLVIDDVTYVPLRFVVERDATRLVVDLPEGLLA